MTEPFDMSGLLEQAQKMAAQIQESEAQRAETEVTGTAGGGLVSVTVTGAFEFRAITIDPAAIDPEDPQLLEDLVLAALHDAVAEVHRLGGSATDGLDIGGMLGGLGLGDSS